MKPKRERINKKAATLMALFTFVFAFILITGTNANAEMYSSISGRVIAEDTGRGLGGVIVDAVSVEGDHFSTVTNDEGLYVIKDLKARKYFMTFAKKHFPYIIEEFPTEVTLSVGKNLVNVNYAFKLGGSISGTVYSEDGVTPLSKVGVSAEVPGHPEGIDDSKAVLTDSNGRFLLQGLPESDKCTVTIMVPGHVDMTREVRVVKGDITEGINFVVKHDDITGISGYVKSSIDGRPIENAEILLFASGRIIGSGVTDANGKYFVKGLPPGRYEAMGFDPKGEFDYIHEKNILVESGKSTKVNFEFPIPAPSSWNETGLWEAIAGFFVSPAHASSHGGGSRQRMRFDKNCSPQKTGNTFRAYMAVQNVAYATPSCMTPQIYAPLRVLLMNDVVEVSCPTSSISNWWHCDFRAKKCAYTYEGTTDVWLCDRAFPGPNHSAGCGCLQAVLFHELLHDAGQPPVHDDVWDCHAHCFACSTVRPGGSRCCCP